MEYEAGLGEAGGLRHTVSGGLSSIIVADTCLSLLLGAVNMRTTGPRIGIMYPEMC